MPMETVVNTEATGKPDANPFPISRDESVCKDCPWYTPESVMISHRGPIDAEVVVIGQCPGAEEAHRGVPFVGPSGRLLVQALGDAGFDTNKILFTNAVWCAGQEKPPKETLDRCKTYVQRLLKLSKRRLLILLGNEAHYAIHGGSVSGVLQNQGRVEQVGDALSVWLLHPAYILRNLAAKGRWVSELQRAFALIEGKLVQPEFELEIVGPGFMDASVLTDEHWIRNADTIAMDIETTGLDWTKDKILGVGLSSGKRAIYLVFRHSLHAFPGLESLGTLGLKDNPDLPQIVEWLRSTIGPDRRPGVSIVGHNLKFDNKYLYHEVGFTAQPTAIDTMVLHHLVDENEPHGLKALARTWLMVDDWDRDTREVMISKTGHLGHLPIADVANYCASDCVATEALSDLFRQRAIDEGYWSLYKDLVGPLSDELLWIEVRGLLVDIDAYNELDRRLSEHVTRLRERVRDISGYGTGTTCPWRKDKQDGMNPDSNSQDLPALLFSHEYGWGIEPPFSTETGRPSVDAKALAAILEGNIPTKAKRFINALLDYKHVRTWYTTFVKGLRDHIHEDGTVHTTYMFDPVKHEQAPRTGRLCSSRPNVQNVPPEIRPVYKARDGYVFVESDYSQLEARVWAHLSGDPLLIKIFERANVDPEFDFHRIIASVAFGVPPDEVTKDQRNAAKVILFGGVMYGGGEYIVSEQLHKPVSEVEDLMRRLFSYFPTGQAWLHRQVMEAHRNGFVRSTIGRRRRLPDIQSSDRRIRSGAERQARNSVIQGLASDINNMSLIRINRWLRGDGSNFDAKAVNLVHDSLLYEVRDDQVDDYLPNHEALMTVEPFEGFGVPLQVKSKVSTHWGGKLDIDAICD